VGHPHRGEGAVGPLPDTLSVTVKLHGHPTRNRHVTQSVHSACLGRNVLEKKEEKAWCP
jgi:hypothetical protein